MKAREDSIKSVGLSLLYEPDEPTDPVADIVFIHGIGGHPIRSWKCPGHLQIPTTPNSTIHLSTTLRRKLKKNPPTSELRRSNSEPLLASNAFSSSNKSKSILRKNSLKSSSSRQKLNEFNDPLDQRVRPEVYWPLDLLPSSCPAARVYTWGYHTLVVDRKPLRLQNDIFAHAGELLRELSAARTALATSARPIIFVAHSTGGILLKEALRLSEMERDGPLKEILLSTSAVVFLGCPHRATEHSTLADAIKSMAAVTFRVDSHDAVLQHLSGANSVDAELGRQAFVRIWNDYNFKVKTFQESIIPSYRFLELRAEATIRRLASFIGDPRENAETISALHGDLCKFGSLDDPGYHAVASSLARLVSNEEARRHVLNTKETECLAALVRPHFTLSETHPATSYPGTCLWLYDLQEFQAWHHRSDSNKNKILWIKGESGCGKTILLRSLRRRLERQWGAAGSSFIWTTAEGYDTNSIFFPGTSRQQHEVNPANVYRSLLAQLFLQDPNLRRALLSLYNQPRSDPLVLDDALIVSFFADDYIDQRIQTPTRRTFIFVDIADDASPAYVEELVCRLSQLARNSDFSICVASAYYPDLEEANAINIVMHLRNSDDVLRYINLNLVAEWEERNRTVIRIGEKAAGVFLWAEIVVNILNAAITEGASEDLIEYTLEEVPGDLHGLYEWMLATLNEKEKAESLTLFQWVILSAEPMRLNDLFIAIRLTEPNPFVSYDQFGPFMALHVGMPLSMRDIRQLRNSEITSDTPYQFHRWLRARSIGLLELKTDSRQTVVNEPLGLQRVQPIHSSVRTFFLSGRGFACLAEDFPSVPPNFTTEDYIDVSHYSLLRACLTYLNMRDFEHLGHNVTDGSRRNSTLSPLTSPRPGSRQQQNAFDQRNLIMSSYPFLQYAVDNLLFHMLSPRFFRYFLPQHELLLAFSVNRARLWRRWTSLLGTADGRVIVAKHSRSSATAGLLSPVFGARFRLERVFRKLEHVMRHQKPVAGKENGGILSPITPIGPASPKTPRTLAAAAAEEKTFWAERSGEAAVVVGGGEFRLPPIVKLPVPKRTGPPAKSPVKASMIPVRSPVGDKGKVASVRSPVQVAPRSPKTQSPRMRSPRIQSPKAQSPKVQIPKPQSPKRNGAVLRIPAFHHGVRRIHRTIEDFRYGRNPHEPLRPGEATEDPEKVRGDGGGFLRYFVEELRNQARGGSGSGTNPPGPPASRG
ncbi:hypothetical protein QBC47DRAFT_430393 [Echria macrotheca]|uniref:Nephrocystin 3-like N-terminal domain-containing protein n=1 Tax=Echria macrotheca TaxID=438768 RepID=A0AAJ0F9X4_9PEZI|nr:hypothetical protein QBC47DRAFT_430393 [Echria macrotheca]